MKLNEEMKFEAFDGTEFKTRFEAERHEQRLYRARESLLNLQFDNDKEEVLFDVKDEYDEKFDDELAKGLGYADRCMVKNDLTENGVEYFNEYINDGFASIPTTKGYYRWGENDEGDHGWISLEDDLTQFFKKWDVPSLEVLAQLLEMGS